MYKDILLPIDLEHESTEKAVPVAVNLCQLTGANLHVLAVLPDVGMSIVSQYFPKDYEKKALAEALERCRAFVKQHVPDGIQVRHVVGSGTVYDLCCGAGVLGLAAAAGAIAFLLHTRQLGQPGIASLAARAGPAIPLRMA
ncbi:MAG: universal stress protein, partial [Proteobacteria bacterium]|nr:universal stress protein [Pseudomonadota bacterium]